MTGNVLNTYSGLGTRLNIVIQTVLGDAFTYFVDNGNPLDFPTNAAMSYDGTTMTINSLDYTVGRYDQTLNITELTAV